VQEWKPEEEPVRCEQESWIWKRRARAEMEGGRIGRKQRGEQNGWRGGVASVLEAIN
jgi:hypothetical protein